MAQLEAPRHRRPRPECPHCGEPFEDDGDRYYLDQCWECGWESPERVARKLAPEQEESST